MRLISPWIAVGVGVVMVVIGAGGFSETGEKNTTILFFVGIALVVIGIGAFFVARWMAKRGI